MAGLVGRPVGGLLAATGRPVSTRERRAAFALVVFVIAIAVIVFPQRPASAGPTLEKRADVCSIEEWQADPIRCVSLLPDVATTRTQCLKAPTPDTPDSGLAGWFASRPPESKLDGFAFKYTDFGYAGYSYTTYDIGCLPTVMHPDYKFENTVANGELLVASGILGASNALRERAWNPGIMWGWADPLVEKATRSIYTRVFSVFGAVTLVVVGVYLLWRSRQAEMSLAMTTAGWALLVMVVVTALASWPVFSAHLADRTLVSALGVVHDALGPQAADIPEDQCVLQNKDACKDTRSPAMRSSDTAVHTMLYRNWLRGLLGSADSTTAQRYGEALYRSRTFSWDEQQSILNNPSARESMIERKSQQWMKVAEQIKTEDPQAYEYLSGVRGMDRIGAGFIAMLAAIMFALFDITASLLVLLGFLIFRWAVIAAPILGTVGMLRPASAGFRRLVNAVVAAIFNIVIFGTGAAIYLFAVDLIMNTPSLPGWLQVVLVWLCGVVGWLLLRPYRRITQLGGKDPAAAIASAGTWHRRFFRDVKETAPLSAAKPETGSRTVFGDRPSQRVEVRVDTPYPPEQVSTTTSETSMQPVPRRRTPAPSGDGWSEPPVEATPAYAVYRPRRSSESSPHEPPSRSSTRAEARQDV